MKPNHVRRILQFQTRIRGREPPYYPVYSLWRSLITPLRLFYTKSHLRARDASASSRQRYGDRSLLEFSKEAEEDSWSFAVIPDFVSPEEEESLMRDISRSLRGKKYQFDHWDGVSELVSVSVEQTAAIHALYRLKLFPCLCLWAIPCFNMKGVFPKISIRLRWNVPFFKDISEMRTPPLIRILQVVPRVFAIEKF